jgi:hypothetical protein
MLEATTNVGKTQQKFRAAKNFLSRLARKETKDLATEFKIVASTYPPETEANSPPPPYWQRGVGRMTGAGGANPRSQNLGDQWRIEEGRDEFTVSNPVTYAVWVHDPDKQAEFHKRRGWKTVTQFLKLIGLRGETPSVVSASTAKGREIASKVTNGLRSLFS